MKIGCPRRVFANQGHRKYDTCFLKWYSESKWDQGFSLSLQAQQRLTHLVTEYLRGIGKSDDNECSDLFKNYQKCLNVSYL